MRGLNTALAVLGGALLVAAFSPAAPPAAPEVLKSTNDFATGEGLIADREALPGAALWKANCAMCHSGTVQKAPHLQWLEMMPPAAIVRSLTTGVMAAQGSRLSDSEKLHIAEYVTRVSLKNGLPVARHAPRCTGPDRLATASGPVPVAGWGHDARRFVADGGVRAETLGDLELKWAYVFPGATRARSQPAIAMGSVFVGGEDGRVMALDLQTGCERWAFEASAEVRTGIVLADGPGTAKRAYFGDIFGKLYALDARTGKLLWARRMDDHPSATLTATPLFHAGRLYVPVSSLEVVPAADPAYPCCTFRGSTVALDAETGAEIWRFFPIPDAPAEVGRTPVGTKMFGPSGAPMWISPTVDAAGTTLYLGSGQNYSTPADGNSDAIFAVDIATGKRRWQRQTITGDAWNVACMMEGNANCPPERGPDFDHSSSILPIPLADGRTLLVAGHKTGRVYGLNPDGGAPLWITKVGRGSIQGGIHFGMAAEGATLYAPVNDMNNTRNGQALDPALARPGMHAIDAATGKLLWSRVQPNLCTDKRPFCDPGISAAVTAVPGAVIAGHMDGHIRAYAREDGRILWDVDTTVPVRGVNGLVGKGGGMSGPGAAVGEGHVAINSGYGLYFHEPGNLFLVYGPKGS
jgi:polyvinyl alcohol dehydrogenase (cytochrome)